MAGSRPLGRGKFISQNALSAVLQELSESDQLPKGTSRRSVKRSREAPVDVSTPYGPLLVHQQANVETMRKGELQQAKVDIHFTQVLFFGTPVRLQNRFPSWCQPSELHRLPILGKYFYIPMKFRRGMCFAMLTRGNWWPATGRSRNWVL